MHLGYWYTHNIEDVLNSRFNSFLNPITPDQEPPFDKFIITQLGVRLDEDTWRIYGWKISSKEAMERHTKIPMITAGKATDRNRRETLGLRTDMTDHQ